MAAKLNFTQQKVVNDIKAAGRWTRGDMHREGVSTATMKMLEQRGYIKRTMFTGTVGNYAVWTVA